MSDLPDEGYTELRDAIAETIPNAMFASPVVGIGGARRQKVADYAMRAVLPALDAVRAGERAQVMTEFTTYMAARPRLSFDATVAEFLRAQVLAEVDAALRDEAGWLRYELGESTVAKVADYLRDTLGAGGDGEGE